MDSLRIYVAGPRSGVAAWNTPAFESASDDLRSRGYEVVSPTELGNGVEEGMTGEVVPLAEDVYWRGLSECVRAMTAADVRAVVVLPGWSRSRGARLETFVAHLRRSPVFRYPDLRRVSRLRLALAWACGH